VEECERIVTAVRRRSNSDDAYVNAGGAGHNSYATPDLLLV
jgi:hypothetical protein